MLAPDLLSRPADIYTIRITEHDAQVSLAMSLRRLVVAAGGTFMVSLMQGPGFIFRMPTTAPCPLTSYLHGGLLEEGCVHISKMRLDKDGERASAEDEESDAESVDDDDAADHPGLRMQWNWTELKEGEKK